MHSMMIDETVKQKDKKETRRKGRGAKESRRVGKGRRKWWRNLLATILTGHFFHQNKQRKLDKPLDVRQASSDMKDQAEARGASQEKEDISLQRQTNEVPIHIHQTKQLMVLIRTENTCDP